MAGPETKFYIVISMQEAVGLRVQWGEAPSPSEVVFDGRELVRRARTGHSTWESGNM